MLQVDDLAFGYGTRVVGSGVTFSVAPGETLAVLGSNGSGKTTLFRTLLGLLPPLSGRVTIDGEDIANLAPQALARRLAYVPQQQTTAFAFTVDDAVLMAAPRPSAGLRSRPRATGRRSPTHCRASASRTCPRAA